MLVTFTIKSSEGGGNYSHRQRVRERERELLQSRVHDLRRRRYDKTCEAHDRWRSLEWDPRRERHKPTLKFYRRSKIMRPSIVSKVRRGRHQIYFHPFFVTLVPVGKKTFKQEEHKRCSSRLKVHENNFRTLDFFNLLSCYKKYSRILWKISDEISVKSNVGLELDCWMDDSSVWCGMIVIETATAD